MPNVIKGCTYSARPSGRVMSEVWLAMFVYLPGLRFCRNALYLTCKKRMNYLSIYLRGESSDMKPSAYET